MESIEYPDESAGTTLGYVYDDASRVIGIEGPSHQAWVDYNKADQPVRVVRGGIEEPRWIAESRQTVTQYGYDATTGDLSEIKHTWNQSAYRRLKHTYETNGSGLRSKTTIDRRVPEGDANLWIDYEYDKLGRLTAEVGQSAADATQYYRLYNYDKAGNRTVMALYGVDSGWTRWWMDYSDRNKMTKRYDAFDQYDWTGGMNRWSYDYDANGNLTQAKKEEKVEGNWTETLIWDYTWNVRNEMTSASKTENGNYAGKVEYGYSLIQAGARTERIQYDASDNEGRLMRIKASWKGRQERFFGSSTSSRVEGNPRRTLSE